MNWNILPIFTIMLCIYEVLFWIMPDVLVMALSVITFWIFILIVSFLCAAWLLSVVGGLDE